jgi:hypothetical protein
VEWINSLSTVHRADVDKKNKFKIPKIF